MVPMGSTMEHKWSITTHCGRGMTVWIEAKTFCISKVLVTYLKWIRDKTDGDHEDDGIDSVGDVSVETHQGNPRSNLPRKQTKKTFEPDSAASYASRNPNDVLNSDSCWLLHNNNNRGFEMVLDVVDDNRSAAMNEESCDHIFWWNVI